ncbi:extracellular solute-binding protein [Rhizobium sp. LC145]|uniref:ABC transporter substrate-binding protein n=1 Tax=Rhizobium sp. LC145 TaxID=1120688 RepID=UPI00062A3CCF|nr:extracellular solute-binding protein [Rhizobium sp. LC145]KKX27070.1 ABC transporter substrate-binding protein [Rhizobium sp. LC145]TKT56618.1 extracellular solute-binding protein [Rhizobiaceae bacterium LC148]
MKTLKRLLAVSALAIATTGTAQAEDLTVWIISYSAESQVKALQTAAERFEKSHPDVNVEIVQRGVDEHKTALRVAAGSDKGPDVYMSWAGLGLGGEYVKAGLSRDLTPYYSQYGWDNRLTAPSLAFASSYGSGKHGVPFRFSGEGLYYNKAMFEQAGITEEPKSYEELVEAAKKLKEAGIPAFTFGGSVNWHLMRLMDELLETTCGAELHDQLKSLQADWSKTECATKAFAEMQMWGQNYILSPFMGVDQKQSFTLFLAKRAAMMLEGDWLVSQIKEGGNLDDYGVFPFPNGTGRLYGFAEYFYISSKTSKPDLAAEFIDSFTSTEFQTEIAGVFGALSVNKEVKLKDDASAMHKEWTEIFAEATGTFVNGDQAFPLDVTTEYFRVINDVAAGRLEPQAAAGAMQTFIGNRK